MKKGKRMDNRFRGWCCLIALMAAVACATAYAAEEVFIPKVYESLPQAFDVDLERNMMLYATYNKVHAYDLETGQQRWWKPLLQEKKAYGASFGKDYVIMAREEEFLIFDKETGEELWREYARQTQLFAFSRFLSQTNWLLWQDEKGLTWYNVNNRTEYKGPEKTAIVAITPPVGSRILYALKEPDWSKPPTQIEVSSWNAGTTTLEKLCAIESPGKSYLTGSTTSGNMLLMKNYSSDNESEYTLCAYDLDTGKPISEIDTSSIKIPSTKQIWHPPGHNFYFWKDEDENLLYRLDAATGEVISKTVPENHTLWWDISGRYMGIYEDTDDLCWFASQDSEHNFWLLPFKHNATPRKLLDGKRFLPMAGQDIKVIDPPYLHAEINNQTTAIYWLEGLEKITERPGYGGIANTDRTLVATCVREDDGNTTHLFRGNEEAPLFKVKGEPLALSPVGRYLVVEVPKNLPAPGSGTSRDARYDPDTKIYVIEVESQQVVAQSESYRFSRVAAFSPDTHYFAFYYRGNLKIMDIVSGFTEKMLSIPGVDRFYAYHLCFASDSKRLLVSGLGQADVFDASTGAHIVTLKETDRFLERHGSNDDFLSRAGTIAGDYIGSYTNLLKGPPLIRAAFAKDGAQVITIAENMLIRVWDAESGRLIRTIDPKLPEQRDDRNGSINNAIALSGNGAYALTYNEDGFDTGTLWDLEKGVKIRCYTFEGASHIEAAVSEDGTKVYAMINGDLHYLSGAKSDN
jgi:hypothetical protein